MKPHYDKMNDDGLFWAIREAKINLTKHPRSIHSRNELKHLLDERRRRDELEFFNNPTPDLNAKNF